MLAHGRYYDAATFPGERYLTTTASSSSSSSSQPAGSPPLPHYEAARRELTYELAAALAFWFLLVPVLGTWLILREEEGHRRERERQRQRQLLLRQQQNVRKLPSDKKNKNKNGTADFASSKSNSGDDEEESIIDTTAATSNSNNNSNSLACFVLAGSLVTSGYLLGKHSPDNAVAARGVFVAPLFTRDECDLLLQKAHAAARRNYDDASKVLEAAAAAAGEGASSELSSANRTIDVAVAESLKLAPEGWQKKRHGGYPTTDLNLVADPFTTEDRKWLADKFDARLAPMLSRVYGIPPASIRANDMFVVRYDAVGRASLDIHTDSSDVTINVLLNDEFEGGGTRYWDRSNGEPFAHVTPRRPGTVATNSARINHEGMRISNGTRYLLVGFLGLDRFDPFTGVPTGADLFATWLSWSWLSVKFRQGYRAERFRDGGEDAKGGAGGGGGGAGDETALSRLYGVLAHVFETLGDALSEHRVRYLVDDRDGDKYLRALDDAYAHEEEEERRRRRLEKKGDGDSNEENKASWFRGQYLSLDIDGSIAEVWEWRRGNEHRFEEL